MKPVHTFLEYNISLFLCFLSLSLCKRPCKADRRWQHLGHCCGGSKWLWVASGEKKLLVFGIIIQSLHLHSIVSGFKRHCTPSHSHSLAPVQDAEGSCLKAR